MKRLTNECDKAPSNIIELDKYIVRGSMKKNNYEQHEMKCGGMKVILEFPKQSDNDEKVKQEVKAILSSALQEQLQKIS